MTVKSVGKRQHFCTDCCSSHCQPCSNLCHKNPRRKGHSSKPIIETDPKTQDPSCARALESPNKVSIIISTCKEVGFIHIM